MTVDPPAIPTEQELKEFLATPAPQRRSQAIERLLNDGASATAGRSSWPTCPHSGQRRGGAYLAFAHQAIEGNALRRDVPAADRGQRQAQPDAGSRLHSRRRRRSDALASSTSQVFRAFASPAECHDHPFDTWMREQFYGFAALRQTRRISR